ncbi:MAG: hypothetical protein ABSA67_01950 [Candidatus Brocadiia bacterium]|jgi:hypothetical protein
MGSDSVVRDLEGELAEIPALDIHTHLTCGKLAARGLHDVLLYHMVVTDLYAAGCPSGARLTQYPGWPTREEAHSRIQEALPYLDRIRNTSLFWALRTILRDLYDWNEPITGRNWAALDALIRERADDRAWSREIIRRAGVKKLTTELSRRGDGGDDDLFHYSMEWAFFTRTQRGEYDTALYELERCWGKKPGTPIPHAAGGRPASDRIIRTVEDVRAAMAHFVKELAASRVLSIATHISTDISFRRVTDGEMESALARRAKAGAEERDLYASYIHELFLEQLTSLADPIVFQFSFAAEPMPFETASLIPQRAIADLAAVVARHPKVKFLCFLASRHANQSLCTLCRELPNLSLAGYWWHNFFPDIMRQVLAERLDLLPLNKQIGFFTDAYSLEWTYGKAFIIRKVMSRVLADKIESGQYTRQDALDIAREILFETPQSLLGMVPAKGQ